MIIKVVELSRSDGFTHYDDGQNTIKQDRHFTLTEGYLNTDHVVSFREADPSFYEGALPEGLDEGQRFTYINLSESRKGITIVESPDQLQQKINKFSVEANLLRG